MFQKELMGFLAFLTHYLTEIWNKGAIETLDWIVPIQIPCAPASLCTFIFRRPLEDEVTAKTPGAPLVEN